MKRSIKFFGVLIIVLSLGIINVKAISLDKTDVSIQKGGVENVNISLNATEEITSVDFSLIFSTYDLPAKFVVNSLYSGKINGINNKVTFVEPVSGNINLGSVEISAGLNAQKTTGYINITNIKATTVSGNKLTFTNQTITANIVEQTIVEEPETTEKTTTKVVEDKKNVLKEIESDIVDIKLKKDVYEYTVNVLSDVTELDLKPILNDNSYKVDISSQKLDEINNKITITLTKNRDKEVYTINVKKNASITKDKNEENVKEFKYKGKLWIASIIFVILFVFGISINKKKNN